MTTPDNASLISAMQVTLDGYVLAPRAAPTRSNPGPTASSCSRPLTRSSWAAGCSPATSSSGRQSSTIRGAAADMLGRDPTHARSPTPAAAAETPHLVLSKTLDRHHLADGADRSRHRRAFHALRQQPGKAVYVVGGPGLVTSLINAGLLDELR